ncbi:MAG TPA: hypothetical protein VGL62_11440, partial [Vicinamibacterales bacterium]
MIHDTSLPFWIEGHPKPCDLHDAAGDVLSRGSGVRSAVEAQIHYPFMQLPEQLMPLAADAVAVVLRTSGATAAVIQDIRRAVAAAEPGDVIYAVETMNDVVASSFAERRLSMMRLACVRRARATRPPAARCASILRSRCAVSSAAAAWYTRSHGRGVAQPGS